MHMYVYYIYINISSSKSSLCFSQDSGEMSREMKTHLCRMACGCSKCHNYYDGCTDCNPDKKLAKEWAIQDYAAEHGTRDMQRYDKAVYKQILKDLTIQNRRFSALGVEIPKGHGLQEI